MLLFIYFVTWPLTYYKCHLALNHTSDIFWGGQGIAYCRFPDNNMAVHDSQKFILPFIIHRRLSAVFQLIIHTKWLIHRLANKLNDIHRPNIINLKTPFTFHKKLPFISSQEIKMILIDAFKSQHVWFTVKTLQIPSFLTIITHSLTFLIRGGKRGYLPNFR